MHIHWLVSGFRGVHVCHTEVRQPPLKSRCCDMGLTPPDRELTLMPRFSRVLSSRGLTRKGMHIPYFGTPEQAHRGDTVILE